MLYNWAVDKPPNNIDSKNRFSIYSRVGKCFTCYFREFTRNTGDEKTGDTTFPITINPKNWNTRKEPIT